MVTMKPQPALIDQVRQVLREEPHLVFSTGRTLIPDAPYVEVQRRFPDSPRKRHERILPLMLGPDDAKLSDILRMLVDLLAEEGR